MNPGTGGLAASLTDTGRGPEGDLESWKSFVFLAFHAFRSKSAPKRGSVLASHIFIFTPDEYEYRPLAAQIDTLLGS